MAFDDDCRRLSDDVTDVGEAVRGLMQHPDFHKPPPTARQGEMAANIMLAYRHLEDATWRLARAMAAWNAGAGEQ